VAKAAIIFLRSHMRLFARYGPAKSAASPAVLLGDRLAKRINFFFWPLPQHTDNDATAFILQVPFSMPGRPGSWPARARCSSAPGLALFARSIFSGAARARARPDSRPKPLSAAAR